jgi:hypothetical protein
MLSSWRSVLYYLAARFMAYTCSRWGWSPPITAAWLMTPTRKVRLDMSQKTRIRRRFRTIHIGRQAGGGDSAMRGAFKTLGHGVGRVFADRLLQLLLLGTICAAFIFAVVLRADASIVFGVLVVGCVTAFVESAHHGRKK